MVTSRFPAKITLIHAFACTSHLESKGLFFGACYNEPAFQLSREEHQFKNTITGITEPAVRVICLKSHSNEINVNGLVIHNNHFASSSCQCGVLNTSSTYFLQQRRVVSIITSWTVVEDPGIFRTETDKNTHTVALFLTRTAWKTYL